MTAGHRGGCRWGGVSGTEWPDGADLAVLADPALMLGQASGPPYPRPGFPGATVLARLRLCGVELGDAREGGRLVTVSSAVVKEADHSRQLLHQGAV